MGVPQLIPARDRHWICAQRLRERRRALSVTQLEVVARLRRRGHHLTNRALSAMENGRGLDVGLLPELADALECSVTYLLGLTTDPASWHPEGWHPEGWHPEGWLPTAGPPNGRAHGVPQDTSVHPVPAGEGTGILGPDVPSGFAAPGRARRRHRANGSPEEQLS
jgi:transcriptional regulator with XRE-family HTH domain